jgi:putative transposase
MPKLLKLHLTAQEHAEVHRRLDHETLSGRQRRRLEVIALSQGWMRVAQIARAVGLSEQTVRATLHAFADRSFASLTDRPRSGRPARLGPADLSALAALLNQDAQDGRTWTLGQLAAWLLRERGVHLSTCHLSRILHRQRFRYKRAKRSVQHKADPDRQAAKEDDLEILELAARDRLLDLQFLDESGFAPSFPVSYTWARIGTRPLLHYEAPQGKRVNVLGALAPLAATPTFTYELTTGKLTADRLLAFLWTTLGGLNTPLGELPSDYTRPRPLVVVLDNASAHVATKVKEYREVLAAADIHLFYLPTYSPHLNRIEALWRQIKYHEVQTRSYATLDALIAAVQAALDAHTRCPHFVDDNFCMTA